MKADISTWRKPDILIFQAISLHQHHQHAAPVNTQRLSTRSACQHSALMHAPRRSKILAPAQSRSQFLSAGEKNELMHTGGNPRGVCCP
jgi:hypothetical protein